MQRCVTPDYGYTRPSLRLSLPPSALAPARDRQASARGLTADDSAATSGDALHFVGARLLADYPQRHLLTLYANETEQRRNEKRVTDKKGGGGGYARKE